MTCRKLLEVTLDRTLSKNQRKTMSESDSADVAQMIMRSFFLILPQPRRLYRKVPYHDPRSFPPRIMQPDFMILSPCHSWGRRRITLLAEDDGTVIAKISSLRLSFLVYTPPRRDALPLALRGSAGLTD